MVMGPLEIGLVIGVILIGLYMAWNIGANDVANALGTSVGSKALTMKQAIIMAAIFEFAGAVLVGGHVTETIRKGMIDVTMLSGDPMAIVYGMSAALLASGIWVQIATTTGLPVSTTHSIVGGVIGFGVGAGGFSIVHWTKVAGVVASWAVSPLMGGVLAFLSFFVISRFILDNP
ncbi:anion permease, partial [Myxococcota bacterium]|nr:anion permease [Myxococcota bacterium]